MAFGRNSRKDSRKSSSSYCSTAILVVFVALCLVGLWMMTSSAVIPMNVSNSVTKPDIKEDFSQTEVHFQDGSGDVTEDGDKEHTQIDNTINDNDKSETTIETKEEEVQEEAQLKETERSESMKAQAYSDENGKIVDNESGDTGGDSDGEGVRKEMQQQNDDEKEYKGEKSEDEKGKEKIHQTVQQAETQENKETPSEVFPDPAQSELLNETNTQTGSWSTQAIESKKEKEAREKSNVQLVEHTWKLCNVSAGSDYIPCLDNVDAIKKLRSTKHYEHRERHCPEESPVCLVPLPEGYKIPVKWPKSRDKVRLDWVKILYFHWI